MTIQKVSIIIIIVIFIVGKASSQSKHCDYFEALKVGKTYVIASPGYSGNYKGGTDCRWAAEAPPGYKISLNCNDVKLSSPLLRCGDQISVSKTGRPDLRDGKSHCRSGAFSETSSSTRITISLKTRALSRGGRFKCSMKAIVNSCNCGQLNKGKIGRYFLLNQLSIIVCF